MNDSSFAADTPRVPRTGNIRRLVSVAGSPMLFTVTIQGPDKPPFTTGFFVDPCTKDGVEAAFQQCVTYAESHGVDAICVLEGDAPVAEAFCPCCGELDQTCLEH